MAEQARKQPAPNGATAPVEASAGDPPVSAIWKSVWPIPVLVLGAGLLVAGVVTTIATRPKADPGSPIADARLLVENAEFEKAIDLLNSKALPLLNAGLVGHDDEQELFRLRALALFQAQGAAGVDKKENDEAIVGDYTRAVEKGATLGPADTANLALTYLALGDAKRAIERASVLPASEHERKRRLYKLVIQHNLASDDVRYEQTLGLLADLSQQPDLSAEDSAWTLARQAELLLAADHPDEAITKLLREMQRLRAVPPKTEGELYYILGRAYTQVGQLGEADKQLERAATLLDAGDPMQADVNLLFGKIRQARGQLEEARDRFSRVLTEFGTTGAFIPALAGLSAVKASLGDDESALESYAELVEQFPRAAHRGGVAAQTIADALMSRHGELVQTGNNKTALRYAVLAESLFTPDQVPPPVLLGIASTHSRLAAEALVPARPSPDAPGGSDPMTAAGAPAVDPVTREEVKRHFLAAGDYYLKHARSVVVEDVVASCASAWNAADSLDRAGDLEEAIKTFADFLQVASDDDPHKVEAKFRLAEAFQAKGEYPSAAALYRELIQGRPEAGGSGLNSAGLWADRSAVPLAQCILQDSDPGNDAGAEELLLSVVSGRNLSPEAVEFRAGLIELGRMYYEAGKYPQAIERLGEVVGRFPGCAEIDALRFRLADSMRLSAREIDKAMEEAMPQSRREELDKARVSRRQEAIRLFQQVKGALESRDAGTLGELDRVYMRNAEFYIGDCAYDLGDYDAAIAAYDAARQKYAADPASLVAMVQIVNAYVQQGQWAKAATANERARQHLERFPDQVWSMPNLPMEKEHWKRWLDSRSLLQQRAEAGPG